MKNVGFRSRSKGSHIMQQGPSRTSSGRYWLWAVVAAAVGLIVLLIAATSWLGIMGAVIILILAFMGCMLILKAWEAGKIPIPFSSPPPDRTIPYYQPSRQSYAQGYQQQSP